MNEQILYACVQLEGAECKEWIEIPNQPSFYSQFEQLTMAEVWQITMAVALLFAVAWVFRILPNFVKQR